MKRLAIPVLTLLLILGMNSMAIALSDGTYDFYGTYEVDQRYADGGTFACALEEPNGYGMSCPATTSFCIKNLVVSNGGTTIESGDGSPYYGIAIGKMVGTRETLDPDGVAPVDLTVGGSSNDDVETNMTVQTPLGGCGGADPCVSSWTTGQHPAGGPGGPGTVTGSIPWVEMFVRWEYPSCADDTGNYERTEYTTETVTARVSNENGADQIRSETGSQLSGTGPYDLTLKTAQVRFRSPYPPITPETDVMETITFDGTLCERTSAGISCIPDEETFCPTEDD